MRVTRERMFRIVRGPAGGMLAMLLLAAALSGVAAADPGGDTGGEHADPQAATEQPEVPDQQSGTDEGPGARPDQGAAAPEKHSAAECHSMIEGLDLPDAGLATGLDHAILQVEANCEANLAAPGPLVALDHLIANRERHAEHEATTDHGRDAEHGNAAAAPGHSGTAPGNSAAAPGHSGTAPGRSGSAPGLSDRHPGSAGS